MSALPCFEQGAVADERVGALHVGQRGVGGLDAGLVAVGPLDLDAFLREQALVVGHQFGQSLERRGGFQDELFHGRLRYLIFRRNGAPRMNV